MQKNCFPTFSNIFFFYKMQSPKRKFKINIMFNFNQAPKKGTIVLTLSKENTFI